MKTDSRGNGRTQRRSFGLLLATALCLSAWSAPSHAADLSGCWEGTWTSCSTGHKGPLQATFTKCGESQYNVDFSGRFFKIIPFRYSVVLNIVSDGDAVVLQGSSYLGKLFGTFHYDAQASHCEFTANYRSCDDHGRFHLTRTCASCAGCR